MTNLNFDTELLKTLSIEEVAKKLGVQLRKNTCLCFIHDEKTPSLHIYPKKNIWKCFGCLEGGDVIEFVKHYNKCDFLEACKWLSNAFGIRNYTIKQSNGKTRVVKVKNEHIYKPDLEVYQWFFDNLPITDKVREFVKRRHYPDHIIKKYNLKGLNDCTTYFEKCKNKWGIERLVKCGLTKEIINKKTGEITYRFTWWTSTLFIPFYSIEGQIVYIQGRTLNPEQEKKYKYVNLNGVETSIFNLPIVKTLTKNSNLVITEGITDCISCFLMGQNAIGIIGANGFRKEYVNLLQNFNIVVIPDNDKAGKIFEDTIREAFLGIGKNIKTFHLDEEYKDISEYYYNNIEKWGN